MRTRQLFLAAVLLTSSSLISAPAAAQPYAWVIDFTAARPPSLPPYWWLAVSNLATGERVAAIGLPEEIRIGRGTLTADGAYYLLSTSAGIARIRTASRELESIFGPPVAATLTEGPSGRLHLVGGGTYYLVDATSGHVLAQRPVSANFAVAFSPSGAVRYELETAAGTAETTVRAYLESGGSSPLWQRTVTGALTSERAHLATGERDVAFGVTGVIAQLVVLSAETGAERGRLDLAVEGLACCHNNGLLVSTRPGIDFVDRLVKVDLATLEQSTVVETGPLPVLSRPREVVLSADRNLAFWLHYVGPRTGLTSTWYDTVDLTTGTVVASAGLGVEIRDIDVDSRSPCSFSLPTSASVGPEGGVVDIPATPIGSCGPWSAHWRTGDATIVNSGPHVGPATLHIVVRPTLFGVTSFVRVFAVGHTIEISQSGATPSPPEASARIVENRAVVSWTVATGAQPIEFRIRGGLRGGEMVTLATVPAATRTWTSAPLRPGSYVVEVVARNYGGESPASNRVELSYGENTVPEPPVNLTVTSADSSVTLTWSAGPTGPAPSGYLVEAALAGSAVFVPVLQVESPRAFVARAPQGTWQVRVRAVTSAGASGPSNTAAVAVTSCAAPPSAPVALHVMPVAGIVSLRWSAPAIGGVEQYVIEGATTASFGTMARFVVDGSRRVYEAPVQIGLYYARVRARNACGESAASNQVIAYVP